jgi:hypothetical protein
VRSVPLVSWITKKIKNNDSTKSYWYNDFSSNTIHLKFRIFHWKFETFLMTKDSQWVLSDAPLGFYGASNFWRASGGRGSAPGPHTGNRKHFSIVHFTCRCGELYVQQKHLCYFSRRGLWAISNILYCNMIDVAGKALCNYAWWTVLIIRVLRANLLHICIRSSW